MRQDPDFALALIYLLSVKQRQMVARLRQATFDSPEQRVIRFLDQFRQTHQDACAEGAPITVNLTHEQIGSLVDLSRVTVTRVLNRLKRDGLLDLDGKKIMLAEGFACAANTPDGPAGSRQAGPRRFNARWCRPAGSGPAQRRFPAAQRHAGLQAHDGALDQRRMQLVPQAGGHVDGGIAMQLVQPGLRRLDERHVHDRIG